jgi:hypothetical protein
VEGYFIYPILGFISFLIIPYSIHTKSGVNFVGISIVSKFDSKLEGGGGFFQTSSNNGSLVKIINQSL